ncbi:hypothetical protein OH76DRAFT_899531 [Lentinus brumalis]|uniref:Uncharacterized protein n=1 Tax=Lentinus brumalis TaxID=2498619 RepID=A0A371D0R2_9APHY|nr:hypothetical protein OH76DRAFT_899531 [Polyporus brumalis]
MLRHDAHAFTLPHASVPVPSLAVYPSASSNIARSSPRDEPRLRLHVAYPHIPHPPSHDSPHHGRRIPHLSPLLHPPPPSLSIHHAVIGPLLDLISSIFAHSRSRFRCLPPRAYDRLTESFASVRSRRPEVAFIRCISIIPPSVHLSLSLCLSFFLTSFPTSSSRVLTAARPAPSNASLCISTTMPPRSDDDADD